VEDVVVKSVCEFLARVAKLYAVYAVLALSTTVFIFLIYEIHVFLGLGTKVANAATLRYATAPQDSLWLVTPYLVPMAVAGLVVYAASNLGGGVNHPVIRYSLLCFTLVLAIGSTTLDIMGPREVHALSDPRFPGILLALRGAESVPLEFIGLYICAFLTSVVWAAWAFVTLFKTVADG
jgi:hypothetical protein